jgi:hypothetical protein
VVLADLFQLIRSEPGHDRGAGGRIQGVEQVVDVLSGGVSGPAVAFG